MSARKSEIPVAGGSLAAYRFSEQDGPVVVAVHGITGNSHAFGPIARALQGRASVLAVDLRGRGSSLRLPGPYGLDSHVRDLLAVLDAHNLERALLIGHSLGAYIIARLAVHHPERVKALVLIDGGLHVPGSQVEDPQAFLEAFLGGALARLSLRFASAEDYYAWWRAHPAFAAGDVADVDLRSFADHDLVGSPPELHCAVSEEGVRADGADVILGEEDAGRLAVNAKHVCAPFGLQGEPNPMQPLELVERWAAEAPQLRSAILVPAVNHYTIALSAPGAEAVADATASLL